MIEMRNKGKEKGTDDSKCKNPIVRTNDITHNLIRREYTKLHFMDGSQTCRRVGKV